MSGLPHSLEVGGAAGAAPLKEVAGRT